MDENSKFFPDEDECTSEQVCRTCSTFFNQDCTLIPIFKNKIFNVPPSLILFELNITENDGLPQQICKKCYEMLISISKFHKLCKKSQKLLKNYFYVSNKTFLSNSVIEKSPLEINNMICQEENEENKNDYQNEYNEFNNDFLINDENSLDSIKTQNENIYENKNIELINHDDSEQQKSQENALTIVCETCNINFEEEKSYNIHVREHRGSLPYICKYCEKDFETVDQLKEHKTCHYIVQCEYCGQIFQHIASLKLHQFKKHDVNSRKMINIKKNSQRYCRERNFKCPLCPEAFILPSALQKHMNLHNTDRKYQCSLCNYGFKRSTHLQRHFNNVHGTEKPYECRHCDRTFKDTEARNKHERWHKNEKFECKFCKRIFKLKEHLVTHERLHTRENRSSCILCGQKFLNSTNLAYHFRSQHTTEESEALKDKILADNADLIEKNEVKEL